MESTATSTISNISIKSACQMFSPVIQPIGEALLLLKVFLPLLLIVICSFDILKIVISNKKDKGNNGFKTIIFAILIYIIFGYLTYFPPKASYFTDPTISKISNINILTK